MSESSEITDAKLAPLMEYFGERVNRVCAYFACTYEFDGDADRRGDPTLDGRAWRLKTIENACMDATLLALRDLDDFLSARTSKDKPDDVRASDFAYEGTHSFLSKSERDKINKLIAHTTTVGAASQDLGWDILELATKGITQCIEFLAWVEKQYGLRHFNLYTAALAIRRLSEAQLAFIQRNPVERNPGRPRDQDE